MRKHDILSGLFWVAVGSIFCIGALRIGLGTPNAPRGGFFPFWAGVIMISLGLFLAINSFLKHSMKDADERIVPQRDTLSNYSRNLGVIIALLSYAILLEHLGYLITTCLLMIFLLAFKVKQRKWVRILAISILTSLVSYVFFVYLLQVELPQGILQA